MMFVWEDIKIMKIKILIPIYNDWQSVDKLLMKLIICQYLDSKV